MLPSVGMPELIIILVIALIIFGPRKLPELGRSLGKSIGEFRKASNELKSTLEEEIRLEEQKDPVGVVLGTMGVERYNLKFTGQAAHSGAAPLHLRKDAFLAAAQFALDCRALSIRHSGKTPRTRVVATCGVVKVVWRLKWHTSKPRSPGRAMPRMALRFAPSMYTCTPLA